MGYKLATLLIALILAWIAYQQLIVNRRKLRLDLYNRRFAVYSNALNFFQNLIDPEHRDGGFDLLQKEFIISCQESRFLFEEDVYKLLGEMNERSFRMIQSEKRGKEMAEGQPEQFANQFMQDQKWILGEFIQKLSPALDRYLDFRKII